MNWVTVTIPANKTVAIKATSDLTGSTEPAVYHKVVMTRPSGQQLTGVTPQPAKTAKVVYLDTTFSSQNGGQFKLEVFEATNPSGWWKPIEVRLAQTSTTAIINAEGHPNPEGPWEPGEGAGVNWNDTVVEMSW